uniref:ATP synthase F1 subunit alpha n=1 Tax=Ficedula albicollis TaxID=59894 RepID=A0A803V9T0_FICAL
MREARFRDHFWSTDLTSTVGYDSIIQHLNDGRKNCKEFEDFLKERAIIEEKYGKELINLSKKKPCGQTELNTLKRSLDVFKQQIDNVGQGHIQLAQTLREEAKKMEDFREKQKLHRKKIELIMEAIHKNRNLQYKKTMEAKRLYEQRCRDKDEAEQAVHRNANLVTQKQQEKLFLKLAQTKSALEDTDRSYQQSVTTMEKIREEWQNEHIKACEVNAPKHLHMVAWSSGFAVLQGSGTVQIFLSVYSPDSECIAANPLCVSQAWLLDSRPHCFKVHALILLFFFPHRLLKLTESR